MTTRSLFAVLTTTVGLAALGSISGAATESGTFSTPARPMGHGTVRAYIQVQDERAVEVGMAITAQALEGLAHEPVEVVLALPIDNPTPYRHVMVRWNPHGHEPLGAYDQPHLDFHFYTITNAERVRIDPVDPMFATRAANYPGSAFIPRGYVAPRAHGIPLMGVHWVDATAPELNGGEFTRAFIYGSWDGRVIFAEPMVTTQFLESRADVTMDIPVAERHRSPGQYPSQFRIYFDETANEHRIALLGFAHRS